MPMRCSQSGSPKADAPIGRSNGGEGGSRYLYRVPTSNEGNHARPLRCCHREDPFSFSFLPLYSGSFGGIRYPMPFKDQTPAPRLRFSLPPPPGCVPRNDNHSSKLLHPQQLPPSSLTHTYDAQGRARAAGKTTTNEKKKNLHSDSSSHVSHPSILMSILVPLIDCGAHDGSGRLHFTRWFKTIGNRSGGRKKSTRNTL